MDFAEATVRAKPLSFGPPFLFGKEKVGGKRGKDMVEWEGRNRVFFVVKGQLDEGSIADQNSESSYLLSALFGDWLVL